MPRVGPPTTTATRPPGREATPQQNAALITLQLARGERMTTAEVAGYLGITWHGARRLMTLLGGPGIPLTRDDAGRWCLMEYIY